MTMSEDKIRQGVELLRGVKREITMVEATDLLELITEVPETIRNILEVAEKEGIVKRTTGRLVVKETPAGGQDSFDYPKKIKRPCADHCKRCNRIITSCHYIVLSDSVEVGPLGSECVKKFGLG